MDLSTILSRMRAFSVKMNQLGIPIWTIRDPKTGLGSVSLTLLFVSSVLVLVGLIGKWSGKLGGVDVSNALQFFYAASALYFGRKFQSSNSSSLESLNSADKAVQVPVAVDNSAKASQKVDNPDA